MENTEENTEENTGGNSDIRITKEESCMATKQTVADPWLPLPQAPAAAAGAGAPVSYQASWRGASAGEFLTLRKGRGLLANRDDFLRWAGARQDGGSK